MDAPRRVPVPANGRLSFPLRAGEYTAVDIVGYYVAPGTPAVTSPATSIVGGAAPKTGAPALERESTSIVHSGSSDVGSVYLNGGYSAPAGVALVSTAAAPSIVADLGEQAGQSSFSVGNKVASIMKIRSDGAVHLGANAHFFDGRTDFFGTPGSYYGYVSIPTNVIHDVTLVNPRDGNNSNASRLVFFNAVTDGEVGSPATTKFRASTTGYDAQENLNYESVFHWHMPNQYHFRATSSVENKHTFWVKAATGHDSVSHTRADMYVSGLIGAGVSSPTHTLDIAGHNASTAGSTMQISSEIGNGTAWANQVNITNARAGYGLILGFNGPGNAGAGYHRPSGAHLVNVQNGPLTLGTNNAARVTVAATGAVGIGNNAPLHALDVSGNVTIGSGYGSSMTVPANGLIVEGSVGIGVPAPEAKLHVGGEIRATTIRADTVLGAVYQDLAEWVPATADLAPGTVVVLNPDRSNEVMPSNGEYDSRVAGVVSAQPGIILGEGGDSKEMVATTGRVKVKVDATRGAIRIGDLLVSSGKTGTAMKSQPIDVGGIAIHRPGTIIGKALEPLESGEGEILVLLSMQ